MIGQGSTTGKGLFYMSYVYQKFGFTMELGQYEAYMDAMFDVDLKGPKNEIRGNPLISTWSIRGW